MFCNAQIFCIRPDEVEKRTAALKAVAGQDLPFREEATGVVAVSGQGDGETPMEAIHAAVFCGAIGQPDDWRAVNVTAANNPKYVFADVLVW